MRHLVITLIILFSAPAFSTSATICGLQVVSNQGIESCDFVYYQVDPFFQQYLEIQAKIYPTNDDCWLAVEDLLRDTPFIKQYGFERGGAPIEFRKWYTDWFNGTFMNDIPNSTRSKLLQPVTFPNDFEI